jgi:hypothetical protein
MAADSLVALTVPPRPPIADAGERDRVEHTALRVRMISGDWEADLAERIRARVGARRARAWGRQEPIVCPLADCADAVAVLYLLPPVLHHADRAIEDGAEPTAADRLVQRLQAAGLWVALARMQRLCEALNEVAVAVDVVDGAITIRLVTPDLLDGVSRPGRPGVPAMLAETRLRQFDEPINGQTVHWVRDVYDISNPALPRFSVHLCTDNTDVTGLAYVDEAGNPVRFEGPTYRWRHADDRPFIPLQLYHQSGCPLDLFEPRLRSETVAATFNLGVLIACQDRAAIDASHPQRWIANGRVLGAQTRGEAREEAAVVESDATIVMQIEASSEDNGHPVQVGQWSTAAPGQELQDLIDSRIRSAAVRWGIPASELIRKSDGGDPRSGVAIAISDAGKRQVQAQRGPIYAPGDAALIGKIAALLNLAEPGAGYPETGWTVQYQFLPITQAEQEGTERAALAAVGAGLISRAEGRARITGEPVEVAQARLPAPPPTTTTAPPVAP